MPTWTPAHFEFGVASAAANAASDFSNTAADGRLASASRPVHVLCTASIFLIVRLVRLKPDTTEIGSG